MEAKDNSNKIPTWQFWVIIAILVALVIGITLAWIYFRDRSQQPAVTDTLVPTAAAPTTAPPTSPEPVVIQTFSVDRQRIMAGECANLNWVVENADTIRLQRDGGLLMDQAPANHTFRDCLELPGTYVYRLEVENSTGSSNWMELQVIVDPQPQPTATQI